jgi:toxin ParE1/3/4
MTRFFSLTTDAKKDVAAILRYTRAQWGDNQVKRYGQLLENCFQQIALGNAFSRTVSPLHPDIQVCRCEHHYVFYTRQKPSNRPIIIAVLHESMNMLKRLQERL